MKMKKYKNEIIGFGINLCMLLIFWGGMLRKSFNADTVYHMVSPDADVLCNIEAGRYVIALGDALLLKLGIRVTTNLSITMLFAFVLFAMTMVVIQKIFEAWKPEEQWAKLGYFGGLSLVFLNVLFSELLMFSECSFYFALGYLLAALGVERFTRKKYVSMFILFIVAVCSYQYTMIFAAILVAFYVCLKNEKLTFKAAGQEMFGIVACMGIGGLNYLSIKILEKIGIIKSFGKYAGWGDTNQKMQDFVRSFQDLYRGSLEILPNLWLPLLFILAVMLLITYSCVKEKKISRLLFILIVFAGSMVLLYVIPFIEKNFSFPPRMAFCFYLLQGMLVVTAYVVSRSNIRRILSLGCVGYLMIQLLFSDFVVTNHFVSNTLDEVYVNMMYQEVQKYEEETGVTVTKIAVFHDTDSPDSYAEVNYHAHQINERSLGTVTNSLIWKVTGRNFEDIGYQEEIFNQYFKDRNWDYLDLSEQLVIVDDTVYWCIF